MTKKYVEIYEKLKSDLIDGSVKFGQKLPSKRAAAELFKASVITVEHAYEILESEGYIEARERSGYYSCYGSKNESLDKSVRFFTQPKQPLEQNPQLSSANDNENEYFPFSVYATAIRSVLNDYGETITQKTPAGGAPVLKRAIKSYLKVCRDISVDERRIVVGSGAEYLYGVIVRLLGNDKIFALEKPSYLGIKKVYEQNGVFPEELWLGSDGILADELATSRASVLHVTPYRSFPSGITASASKREQYLQFASSRGGFVIEDDYQSEFSLSAKLTETLYGAQKNDRVIYVNTFSKTVFPSIRIAYMLLPAPLADKFEQDFKSLSCSVPALEQYALAKIIDDGSFARHLNRVRRARKRACLG